ncbi:MFS transporter [Paucisalibacillus sp. EB02]|uniref:MFS transporter n=1 Tax=Paucisalibacillus sp. EB02 TaxID=1347087 RepID=UPI0004B0530A|nr:MFS transporter [Paucisalibacillus sp. EB02]
MNYRSNIWKLYAIRFLQSLILAYVIERLFWEQRGMTIQMVVYTEIIYAVTVVLLEVPSGIIADKWGRKKMILIGALLESGMFLILIFATEFWHFAVAIFLSGIAGSASSGAGNALLYDSLLLEGKEQSFEKFLGRLNVFSVISAILAALCGSLLASQFNFELNYWLSLASMIVSVCLVLLLVEPAIKSEAGESIAFKDYFKTSVRFFRTNPSICLVVLSGMVTGAALSFVWEFWQLYLNRLEIPVVYFGLVSAMFMFLSLPGNLLAHSLINRFKYRTLLLSVSAILTTGFLYVSVIKNITGLVAISIILLVSGIIEPIVSGYMHHRMDSSMRATIDSFQSLGQNAVLILTGLGFGFFSTYFDVFGGFGFIAFICGMFFIYLLFASKDKIE